MIAKRCLLPCFLGVAVFFCVAFHLPTASAQPPGVKPGDKIEFLDGKGKVQTGEFVEMVGATMVRIKQDDGSTRVFPGNRVRLPGGVAPRPSALRPPMPAAPAPPDAAANPFESPAATSRTWTDASGKFKIEAAFVSLDKDLLQLKKTDGKFITLPLEKLSAEDQTVAKSLAEAAKTPPMKEENPFEANVSDKPSIAGLGVEKKVTLQGVPVITLDAPAAWSAAANPTENPAPAIANRVSTLPARAAIGRNGRADDFFEKADAMIVDAAHAWLWIGVKNEPPGGQKSCRLERIDVASGSVLPPLEMPTLVKPVCVDPTGRYLVTSREDDFHNRNKQLDLWEIDGNEVRATQSFKPYDDGEGKPFSVKSWKWAEFVDGSHLLTLSDGGKLVLWDLATLKASYQAELGTGWSMSCTLSPGRQQLAVATSSGVFLLEPLTGKVLGKCEMKDEGRINIYRVAFSDDGSQLAAVGPLNLWVWNVADGESTTHISGTTIPIGHETALSFGSHKHLVIDHRYAFDIERGLMTCYYTGSWSSAAAFAGREFYLTEDRAAGGKTRGVMQFVLPGDEVVKKAAAVREEELLAIKPGSKISLELNLPFDAAEIEKIRTSATAAFVANGWAVAAPGEASDFTLTASAKVGETKEIEYRMFGRGFATTKVSITYQIGEMVLKAPGVERPVWQNKATWGPPHFLHLKEGQTIEEATRTAPNAAFFANPGIPRRLMKYPNGLSIVSATLAPGGVTVQ
jgi:hypothetical protein